mmetsp:Transcript_8833/g.11080  ORF Transcript_8833/g.11080 Transcript_8833/m.11080 type:complete len:105 (+) Transcript_8833:664-978(+)
MVVLRGMSFVMTPPRVSIPSESGVTSRSRMSFTSPFNTPPWMAAPIATTSSGFTPRDGFFAKEFFNRLLNFGHTGHTTNENNIVNLRVGNISIFHTFLARVYGT